MAVDLAVMMAFKNWKARNAHKIRRQFNCLWVQQLENRIAVPVYARIRHGAMNECKKPPKAKQLWLRQRGIWL